MEAIVLAGGFGTRLQGLIKDIPKPMAPINGKPFLTYVFNYLRKNGVSRFILSVGYKRESIQDYFGDEYRSIPILYAVEETPLGTGGGIKESLKMTSNSVVLVINGDTFFDVDLGKLLSTHTANGADVTLACKYMDDFERYGSIEFDEAGKMVSFKEKTDSKDGYINGGVYAMNRDIFVPFSLTPPFSFETDFLEVYLKDLNVRVLQCEGYFIDIGVPDDYERAQKGLASFDE